MTLTKDDFMQVDEELDFENHLIISEEVLAQILKNQDIVERLKKLDLPYIIQLLKEYGFAICQTSECRYKVASQCDPLQELTKILDGKDA